MKGLKKVAVQYLVVSVMAVEVTLGFLSNVPLNS